MQAPALVCPALGGGTFPGRRFQARSKTLGFELGKTYGDYEVIDVEASSRLGVAYRVRNLKMNRLELLRVLTRRAEEPDQEERFLRESNVRARLNHPNIEEFYWAGRLEGQLVMTTELVEGTTLEERLELGPLPVEEALQTARQALEALASAHKGGIVHRDVRPANLILTPQGRLKLSGFALAKGAADVTLTQVGTSLGEVHYMSPEQVRGLGAPEPASDLYSFGVVLFECLTGVKPFTSKSHFEVMMAHVNAEAPSAHMVRGEIPEWISLVIRRAMSKEAATRFPDAEAFADALLRREEQPATKPAAVVAPAPVAAKPKPVAAAPLEASPPVRKPQTERAPAARMETQPKDWNSKLGLSTGEVVLLGLGVVVVAASALLVVTS
ncbi:MAG: serine/threonine protein kinase [Acidimicrobiia bacterium]|nr:serine/threonine protein kinase [Acidimicrobiia bacterium]